MTTKYLVNDTEVVQDEFELPQPTTKFATEELDTNTNAVVVEFIPPINSGSADNTIREIQVSTDLIDDLLYQGAIEQIQ